MLEISQIIDRFPLLGLLMLLILGFLGLPFPEDMTLILCGFLIANDIVRPVPALVTVGIVMVGLDMIFFYAGRKYGREIVNHRIFRKILSRERLASIEEMFKKWGILIILIGRHIIVLRTQLLIATGIFRMPKAKFIAADLASVPITMLIMIGLGYVGGNSLQIIRKDATRVEHFILLLLLAALLIYLFYRFLRYRRL